jgi:hypothetical protein
VVEIVSDVPGHPDEAGLGDRFTLTVENLKTAIAEAGSCQQLVLFLGGVAVPDSSPERCDPDDGHVGFLLERPGRPTKAWSALLGGPTSFTKPVRVTIGTSEQRSYPTLIQPGGKAFWLVVVPKTDLAIFSTILAGSLVLVTLLARRTALLRKPGPQPALERPYSIGRFQLAFWSVLVAESYLFVWLLTGNLNTITASVLALVGIGSATALGGSLIDSGSKPETAPGLRSRGFLTDLLSDSSGISIHRFQILSWTLILGVIFCASVYKVLEMPEFSPALLGLMGISSGTYLAFKFPEREAAEARERATQAPAEPVPQPGK